MERQNRQKDEKMIGQKYEKTKRQKYRKTERQIDIVERSRTNN